MTAKSQSRIVSRRVRLTALVILLALAFEAMVMRQTMTRIGSPEPTPTMLYAQDLILLPLFCVAILLFGSGAWQPGGSLVSARAHQIRQAPLQAP